MRCVLELESVYDTLACAVLRVRCCLRRIEMLSVGKGVQVNLLEWVWRMQWDLGSRQQRCGL